MKMAGENYYNQPNYYGGRYEAPVEPPHPHKKFKLILIIIILLILITAVVLYFLTSPEDPGSRPRTTTTTAASTVTTTMQDIVSDGLEIRNMLFAESIFDDYQYVTRQSNKFRRGESVIIFFEVAGTSNKMNIYGTYDVNLRERVELRDPNGQRIPELTYLIDDSVLHTSKSKNYIKPFEYFFNLLQSDPLGTYMQTIIIEDKNTGKIASKSITFEVVE